MGLLETDPEGQARIAAFRQGLQELGWTDQRNVRIEYRWAGADPDRMRAYAAELVALTPEVILAGSTPTLIALRQTTRTIPIVFMAVSDPVGQGFVASMARPGGHITGFTAFEFSMGSKWLELLKEIAPGVVRVALLFNPKTAPYGVSFLQSLEAVAPSLAVELIAAPVHDRAEIEGALASLGRESGGGLLVLTDAFTTTHRELIVALAAQHRVPAVYPYRFFVNSGGLMFYGVNLVEQSRQTASYIDRILQGATSADLPVQQAMKFELVLNLKTAQALGLTVPPILLFQADEVVR